MNSAKNKSKNYFLYERIFTERAFSVTTYLTVGIPAGVLAVVADPAMASNDFFTWFGVVTVSTLLAGLFFGVFGSILFKPSKGITRIVLGFVGFAVTGSLRGGLLGSIGLETGVLTEVNWQFRFAGGAVVATVLLPVAAIMVNDLASYRIRFTELTQIQMQLATLRDSAQVELKSKRAILEAGVNNRLKEVINSLSSEAQQGKSDIEFHQLTKSLQLAVESVVRPLSKELLTEDSTFDTSVHDPTLRRVNFKIWLEATTVAKLFSPWPVALIWSVIGASTISALRPGFPGVLAFPIFVLSTWAILVLGERFIAPHLSRVKQPLRVSIILGWYVIASVIPALLSWPPLANIERPGFASLKTTLLVLDPIANIIICIVLALLSGLSVERTRVLNEITDLNQNLRWKLASLQGQLQIHRKQLARSIHNDVQAVFIASAMKLQNAINNGDVSQSLISEITQSLREIEVVYTDTKQVPSLTKAMEDLKSFWGDGVSIDCSFDSATEKILTGNEILRATLIDVCSEAVINAVKHASATKVEVKLSIDKSVLNLNVLNNGQPIRTEIIEGSGMQMTKEVSIAYELRKVTNGTLLSVSLPITPMPNPS
jgi:signal transduction histidine kinase